MIGTDYEDTKQLGVAFSLLKFVGGKGGILCSVNLTKTGTSKGEHSNGNCEIIISAVNTIITWSAVLGPYTVISCTSTSTLAVYYNQR